MKAIKRILSLVLVLCLMLSLCAFPTYADTDAEESSPIDGISSFFEKYIIGFGNFIKSLLDQVAESPSTKPFLKTLLAKVFDDNSVFKGFIANIFGEKENTDYDVNNDGRIDLVTFGASNSNGYGMRGYLSEEVYKCLAESASTDEIDAIKNEENVFGFNKEVPESYPVLVRDQLAKLTGKEVDLHQYGMSSTRIEEFRYLLDNDYIGDAYTAWRFTGGNPKDGDDGYWFFKAMEEMDGSNYSMGTDYKALRTSDLEPLRENYQETVKNADVITLDCGLNNFGIYTIFAISDPEKFQNQTDADGTVFSNDYDEMLQTSVYFSPAAYNVYLQTKALIAEMLPEEVELESSESLQAAIDTLSYALVGYCVNFDAVVTRIRELNPKAKIVALSIQNAIKGLVIEFEGIEIPVGDIFGAIVDIANIYMALVSPNCLTYNFAYLTNDGSIDYFIEDLADYNGNPKTLSDNIKDCFDLYDDDMRIQTRVNEFYSNPSTVATVEKSAALDKVYDAVAKMMQMGGSTSVISAEAFSASDDAEDTVMEFITNAITLSIQSAATDPDFVFDVNTTKVHVADIGEMTCAEFLSDPAYAAIAWLGIRTSIGNNFFSHPSPTGHAQAASSIMNALTNNVSGKEAMKTLGISYLVDGTIFGYKLLSKIESGSLFMDLSEAGN